MEKEEQKRYYRKLKGVLENKALERFLAENDVKQLELVSRLSPEKIRAVPYNLKFKKLEFVNFVASFYYKGRVGRKLDLLVYHDDVLLGYIQYASPIINSCLLDYLKTKNIIRATDFKEVNHKVVDISICVPVGIMRVFLTGKLMALIATSKEIIDLYNSKYGTEVEAVYTTSVYGRSSMYNRLKNLEFIGYTEGYHALLTKDQINTIKTLYQKHFPHRKLKKSAIAPHVIRMYDHLISAGVGLPFSIPKLKRAVYATVAIEPLQNNVSYWFNRWFVPRRERFPVSC